MNKKLLLILSTLFLIGLLSVSCSNEDKTAPNEENTEPVQTGIHSDFRGNVYRGDMTITPTGSSGYTGICTVTIENDGGITSVNSGFPIYEMNATSTISPDKISQISRTQYTATDTTGGMDTTATFTFGEDGNTVTFRSENREATASGTLTRQQQ